MSLNVVINGTGGRKLVTGATYWKSNEMQKMLRSSLTKR